MNILIIGAGNGGLAFGAKLIANGHQVNLYDKFEQILRPIIENNNEITGEADRSLRFHLVTSQLEKAMQGVEMIFVVTPAFAHRSIALELSEYISDDHLVVLHPGRTGGALEVKHIFALNGKKETVVAEAETLLFACRKIGDTAIKIYGTKKSVGVAALPSSKSGLVVDKLNQLLPYFHNSSTVLKTSLSNIGSVFHPTPFLLNIGRVESKNRFKYYHEGITPSIAALLEQLDQERLSIAESFGITIPTALEWLNENYRLNGTSLYEAIQSNASYREIEAPQDVNSRYVLEDVPMSLVPLSEIGSVARVETPLMDAIIELASKTFNRDFRKKGRSLEQMGLKKQPYLLNEILEG